MENDTLDKVWNEIFALLEQSIVQHVERIDRRINLHIERIESRLKHLENKIMTVEELTARLEADASAYTADLETVKTLTASNAAEISTLRDELAAIKVSGDTTRAEAALAIIEGNNAGLSALGTPVAPAVAPTF